MAITEIPPSQRITTEVIASRKGIKIVRMSVPAGFAIAEHHAHVDVVATVIRGAGTFTVADEPVPIGPGSVIEMPPGVRHSIAATEDLELVITHARVAGPDVVDECGS